MSQHAVESTLESFVNAWSGLDDPIELLRAVLAEFGDRAAIGTSGQLSGVTLIDMASRTELPFRVFTVDTLRLHPTTYALWDRLTKRYGVEPEIHRPDPEQLEKMVSRHGEFLFFDSRGKQEYCCDVRKVEPNARALSTVDCWITGLRRDQSKARAETPRVSIADVDGRSVLKIAPLVEYDEAMLWDYIREREVPYDEMFDDRTDGSRYPSLGCIICTTPVMPWEDPRAGRWRWFNALEGDDKKECGIHVR